MTLIEKYGMPIAISPNGVNMVFKKENELDFHCVTFSDFNPMHVNTFDLIKEYK